MIIHARLRQLLREQVDTHAAGYSFLYLTMQFGEKIIYGNPVDNLIVMAVVNDIPFEQLCKYYAGIRRDYPENAYVQSRYTRNHALGDYLTLCYGILHALRSYEFFNSPMNRRDGRNTEWLREYFGNIIKQVEEKEGKWKPEFIT